MNGEWKEKLKNVGVNIETALERFMDNEELYLRFLRKFPGDASYIKLNEAIQNDMCEEAFKCAHTLKGVVGNLALDSLYEIITSYTDELRSGNLEAAKKIHPQITAKYQEIVNIIQEI